MKICFGLGDFTAKGGIEKVTINLANSLSEEEYKISILSLNSERKIGTYKIEDSVELINMNNKRNFHNRKKGIIGYLSDFLFLITNVLKIRKIIKEKKINYIIGTDIKLTFLFYIACCFSDTKIIAMEHFSYETPNNILKKIRKIFYKKLYKVVILTNEDINKYKKIKLKDKLKVIPNIVEYKNVTKSNLSHKRIIAVGRLTYQKGFDMLIEAWKPLDNICKGWMLDIFGEGEEKAKLQKKINKYKLKNIKINNFTKNIGIEYEKSSFYIMTSRFEGLPTVLIEALSYGLPIISFECPTGPKTIILNNKNGELVENGNINEMTKIILKFMENENLLKIYSSHTKLSLDKFSKKEVIKLWKEILI